MVVLLYFQYGANNKMGYSQIATSPPPTEDVSSNSKLAGNSNNGLHAMPVPTFLELLSIFSQSRMQSLQSSFGLNLICIVVRITNTGISCRMTNGKQYPYSLNGNYAILNLLLTTRLNLTIAPLIAQFCRYPDSGVNTMP